MPKKTREATKKSKSSSCSKDACPRTQSFQIVSCDKSSKVTSTSNGLVYLNGIAVGGIINGKWTNIQATPEEAIRLNDAARAAQIRSQVLE